MNHSRRDRFFKLFGLSIEDLKGLIPKLSDTLSKIDNEIQMLTDAHNNHDSGLVGWNAISLEDGSNKRMGQAVLVGGTVTVSNTSVTANTRIFVTRATTGGTAGHLSIGTVVASTSFIINSSSATDTSTVNWLLIEPK